MENFSEFEQAGTAPEKNFSDIMSHAFNNYFKVIGWAILIFLIYLIFSSIISSVLGSIFGYNQLEMQEVMQDAIKNKDYGTITTKMFEVKGYKESQIISSIISLLLYPLLVGLFYILQKGNVGAQIKFTDLFVGYRQNTAQVIIYGLLSGIITFIAFCLCFFPVIFIYPLFLIGLPIVFFENSTAIEGIKKGFDVASKNYWTFVGVNIVAWLVAFGGILLCGIGILASFPFLLAASYSTYCAFCGTPRQIGFIREE